MFVCWNNSTLNPYSDTGILTWNRTGIFMNIHGYSSLFMFLEFQESRVLYCLSVSCKLRARDLISLTIDFLTVNYYSQFTARAEL